MATMTNTELVAKLKDIATNYKTLYVMGCFGAPMNDANKKRYCNNHAYNRNAARQKMIQAASADTFGFDCVCLIKGVLWGWNGNKNKTYGGAGYAINGVPDIGADTMITKCSGVSTDFSKIEVGELVWMKGHVGIYIGDGLAVECTPAWANKVQITACNCTKSGYKRRNWTKHGKLPYITYVKAAVTPAKPETKPATTTPAVPASAIKVGDTVRLNKGAKTYTGGALASFVYNRDHTVKSIAGQRAVIAYNGVTVAAVKVSDLTLISAASKNATTTKPVTQPPPAPAAKTIKVGSTVRLNKGAKTYTGKNLASFVYNRNHKVKEISGQRVVITFAGVTVAAVKLSDLTLVS